MKYRHKYVCICGLAVLLCGVAVQGALAAVQFTGGAESQTQPPATAEALLQQMAAQSGKVFLGTVTGIRMAGSGTSEAVPEWPDGSRMVEVTIAVEECISGCAGRHSVVMREWASLWRGQPHRYNVGQRAVWMLYPESAAGTSSPVRGMIGVLPVQLPASVIPVTTQSTTQATGTVSEPLVDLRWVRTLVLRSTGSATTGATVHPLNAGDASSQATASQAITTGPMTSQSTEPIEQPMAPLSTVLGVLHAYAATANTTN